MTQLNVRIAPSGPLASGQSNPFLEYSGTILKAKAGSSRYASNPPNTTVAGLINPSVPDSATLVLQRTDPGAAQLAAVPSSNGALEAISPELGEFSFGPGVWLVEASLSAGFGTSTGKNGAFKIEASIVNDLGAVVATAVSPAQGLDSALVAAGESYCPALITITPEMVTANANVPFKGFSLSVSKTDKGSTGVDGALFDDALDSYVYADTFVAIKKIR